MNVMVRGSANRAVRCPRLFSVLALGFALMLTACAHEPGFQSARKYKEVKVVFDKEGCPLKVVPEKEEISRSALEGIEWEAIGPAASDIQIFFDPFLSAPQQFQLRGKKVRSGSVAPGAPAGVTGVEYKYTIVARGCPDKPLDPVLIVKN